ncbi:MAG: hypothetical protein O2924_03020 [Chloroflexi bacterium]|nr:hypothetical protein [Chloroflexota bacterium]
MKRYLQPVFLLVPAGLIAGLAASATLIETEPAFLGWVLGSGLGLMGGAFFAAIASGEQLVSGPAPKRGSVGSAPWLDARTASEDDENTPSNQREQREQREQC